MSRGDLKDTNTTTEPRLETLRNLAGIIFLCAGLTGCVHSDLPYNEPSQHKLRLESQNPQAYTVQVGNKAGCPVGADGRVFVDVPRIARGHASYLFGVAKVSESSGEDNAVISVKKDGRTVRKLSLSEIRKLPTDIEGYLIVKVE